MARGLRATVKARGKQRQRTFPIGTSARTIQDWKERERARLLDELPPASRGTLRDDVDRYLDTLIDRPALKKERTRQLHWWLQRFGRMRRSDLTAPAIRAALAELRLTKAASTCNHYRDALAALWTTLDGKDGPNPLRNVPKFTEPESAPRHLPHDLIARLFAIMKDLGGKVAKGQRRSRISLTKLRLNVMFTTGLSPAEIMRLEPTDLALEDRAVYVRRRQKGKGVEGMMLPLTEAGVTALRAFATANAYGRFSTHAVRKTWVTACKALAKLETTTDDERRMLRAARPYDLRHTFGTHVMQRTGDLMLTKELMRHRSTKTTKRYVRAAVPPHLRAAMESLAGGQPASPQPTENKGRQE